MAALDYSKWDNIDVSDDEGEGEGTHMPRVTRLDNPSTVSWGGKGEKGEISVQQRPQQNHHAPAPKPRIVGSPSGALAAPTDLGSGPGASKAKIGSQSGPKGGEKATRGAKGAQNTTGSSGSSSLGAQYSKWDKILADLSDDDSDQGGEEYMDDDSDAEEEDMTDSDEETGEGGRREKAPAPTPRDTSVVDLSDPTITRNGGRADKYLWGQSKGDVSVYVPLSGDARARDVKIHASKWQLKVEYRGTPVVEGRLAYPIAVEGDSGSVAAEGEGEEAELDWEVKNAKGEERRVLCLTLPKRGPAPNVVVWWQSVIAGDPAVAIDSMPDRDTAVESVFQRNWNEAHRAFKEKMKAKKQQQQQQQEVVVVDEEEGDADGDGTGASDE